MAQPVLQYTNLRPGDARITWREDANGITFIACPPPMWRAVVTVIICAGFASLFIFLAYVAIIGGHLSGGEIAIDLLLILPMVLAVVAVAVQAILARTKPPRLRVDQNGAMLIVPDLLWMRKIRFAKDELRFSIAVTGIDLTGRTTRQLSMKKPKWLSGRPVFRGYSKEELDAVVNAATMVLDGS